MRLYEILESHEPLTVPVLLQQAAQTKLFDFLDKHNGEFLWHPRSWKAPTQAHDRLPMRHLDPSELDSWDDDLEASPNHDPMKEPTPILVQGLPWAKYRPVVIDGHHRYKARLQTGESHVDVMYNLKSLISLWLRANHRERTGIEELADEYRDHIASLSKA